MIGVWLKMSHDQKQMYVQAEEPWMLDKEIKRLRKQTDWFWVVSSNIPEALKLAKYPVRATMEKRK